jgi:predicted RNase H-like nuclease (RuvC/YqgF family)
LTPPGEKAEMAGIALQYRLQELEMQNSHLQGLVVELLNKNEQLRRKLAQLEAQ